MYILVKFDEIFLKSEHTKRFFLNTLVKNIKKVCKRAIIREDRGRLIVKDCDIDKLKRIFGIKKVVKAIKLDRDEEVLKKFLLDFLKDKINKNTKFRVTFHRADKTYPKNSVELNKEIGEFILENIGGEVDLENYDVNLIIEVRRDGFYVYLEDWEVEGVGGLPYGVEGETVVSFSGGFDSTLSTWLIAKRGVRIKYLVYFSPIDELPKEVYNVYRKLNNLWFLETKLLVIKGKKIIKEIKEKIKDEYRQIIYKRILYRILEKICLENNIKYFVTGESIGQKASQTLDNLYSTEVVLEKVKVLRPLLAFDKSETINLIRKIGLYEEVSKVKELCKISNKPKTRVRPEEIKEEEKKLDVENLLEDIEIEELE